MCEKQTDKQIIAALKNLPRDLPQTFERILQKFIEADDIDIGKRIFHWVAVAKRPLTAEELQEAIGIEPLQEMWDDKSLINNMKKAIACCGNLVFLDEEQQTIHFTHSSVKQYLSSNAINEHLGHYYVNLEKVDAEIGAICVTYLNFAIFKTQVARSTAISTNIGELPSAIVKNSLSTRTSGNKIALRILRRHNKSSRPVHCLLEEIFNDTGVHQKQNLSKQYPFRSYPNRFWLEHTRQRIDPNSRLWRLWCNLVGGADWRNTLSDILWTSKDCEMHTPNLMR